MSLLYVTKVKEDTKGNQNAFHVLSNYNVNVYGDISTGNIDSRVTVNLSSYISKEKYELGCKCNDSTPVTLTSENSTIDFASTSDQLTNDRLGEEIALYFGGDGSEYIIEP